MTVVREQVPLGASRQEIQSYPRVAFFDIDGTLTRGFTIVSFAEFLARQGFFGPEAWQQMRTDLQAYKASDHGQAAYHCLAIDLVEHYALGLAGQKEATVAALSRLFLGQALAGRVRDYEILGFASELVRLVGQHAQTIAVSGSPLEALQPLIEHLGFDILEATEVGRQQGLFTGQVVRNVAFGTTKQEVVAAYLHGGIDLTTSLAFGDSLHDLPLLEIVGYPFILGDNAPLHQLGRERGWFVADGSADILQAVAVQVSGYQREE